MRSKQIYFLLIAIVVIAVAGLVYTSLHHSSAARSTDKPEPAAKPAKPGPDILQIKIKEGWVNRLALSHDGSKLAAVIRAVEAAYYPYVKVWDVPSGKLLLTLGVSRTHHIINEMAWHPHRNLLAISGGYNSPVIAGGDVGRISGGLLLVSFPSKKIREITWPGEPGEPVAWMPDGGHVIVRDMDFPLTMIDVRSGSRSELGPDLKHQAYASKITVSGSRTVAIEHGFISSERFDFSRILLYHQQSFTDQHVKIGELKAVKDEQGSDYLPTQPEFIDNNKLVYLRWHALWRLPEEKYENLLPSQNKLLETAEAELWTTDENGGKQKQWITLPRAHVRVLRSNISERLYAISADGKTIAYVRDGVIHIQNVSLPLN